MAAIEHAFPFDPTCGYTREALLNVQPPDTEPTDFASFWRATYAETLAVNPEILVRPLWSPDPDVLVSAVSFLSLGGIRIGAYVSRPRTSRGGLVVGHGYGGLSHPVLRRNLTVIAPCIRGFGLSQDHAIPWRSEHHVLHGIDQRETYVLRGSVADIWQAASVLVQLYPETESNVLYSGASFGGGLGALAVPWDKRFRAAHLDVPTFGHHPLRLAFPSIGSGEAVRGYHAKHPEAETVLRYYDAATAAVHTRIPVVCTPALFDPAVVPPGQFAVNNAIPQRFRQTFILDAGHWTCSGNEPTLRAANAAVDALFLPDS